MFKNVLIIVLLALVVFGGYFTRSNWLPDVAPLATSTPEQLALLPEEAVTEISLSGRGTLAEIQKIGTNLECKIWMNNAGGEDELSGTTFISGDNVRGDFMSQVEGKEIVSSMIITGDRLYTWSVIEGKAYGVEKALKPKSESQDEIELDAREPVPLTAEVRYDCVPWRGNDSSVFAPPANVLFKDLELLLEKGQEYGATFEGE